MRLGPLSMRQAQVLQLLAWGYQTEEAADMLGISINTLRNHLVAAARRLGTNNQDRTATVTNAIRGGYISLEPPSPLGKFWKDPE